MKTALHILITSIVLVVGEVDHSSPYNYHTPNSDASSEAYYVDSIQNPFNPDIQNSIAEGGYYGHGNGFSSRQSFSSFLTGNGAQLLSLGLGGSAAALGVYQSQEIATLRTDVGKKAASSTVTSLSSTLTSEKSKSASVCAQVNHLAPDLALSTQTSIQRASSGKITTSLELKDFADAKKTAEALDKIQKQINKISAVTC